MLTRRLTPRMLLGAACALTVAVAGCGSPSPTARIQSDLPGVAQAKSGSKTWNLLSLIAHDNDLSSAGNHYRQAAEDLASYTNLHTAMVYDSPGNNGIQLMGFNGQWFNQGDQEINSGSVDYVSTFLKWSRSYAPAQNTALVLADHGGGIVRGIMFDDSAGHVGMDIPDLARVLAAQPVQLLMFDACLMNMLEVAYELREGAGVLIGAESVTYAGSWPYAAIGAAMNPGGTPEAVAKRVTDAIGPNVYRATVSAIRTSGAQAAAQALDKLSRAALAKMKSDPAFARELRDAIGKGQSYKFNDDRRFALYNSYRDMVSVMKQLSAVSDSAVAEAAREAEAAARAMVIASWRDTNHYPDSNGVSLYAPVDGTVDLGYAKTSGMARETQWDEFLVELNRQGGYSNPLQKDKYPTAFPTLIKK